MNPINNCLFCNIDGSVICENCLLRIVSQRSLLKDLLFLVSEMAKADTLTEIIDTCGWMRELFQKMKETQAPFIERNLHVSTTNFKREHIRKVLQENDNNQTQAAKRLGLQKTYLNRLIKELELREVKTGSTTLPLQGLRMGGGNDDDGGG